MDRRLLILLAAVPAPAAAADRPPPRITVTGSASVATPPDVATVGYSVHGEGATPDAALGMLVAKRTAIDGGLAGLAGATPGEGGEVSVREVRGHDCNRDGNDEPQLSTGACAIIGYTADLSLRFRTAAVRDAGTMAGLIARLGGSNARVEGFALTDETPARRRAVAAALADARQKADAIAVAAGVRLGSVLSASDGSGGPAEDVVVTGSRASAPALVTPPPILLDTKPQLIQTAAQITVVYQIAP